MIHNCSICCKSNKEVSMHLVFNSKDIWICVECIENRTEEARTVIIKSIYGNLP